MSGIAREALWQACLIEAVRSVNPSLAGRRFAHFWWNDMDERDILKGKYDYTYRVLDAENIYALDTEELLAGDMLITGDGKDMKIFMGGDVVLAVRGGRIKATYIKDLNKKDSANNSPITVVRWIGFKEIRKDHGRAGT